MCSFAEVFYMSILFISLLLSLLPFCKKYIFYLPKDFMVLLFLVVVFSILYFFPLHSYTFYNLYRPDILKDTLCHLKRCLHFIFYIRSSLFLSIVDFIIFFSSHLFYFLSYCASYIFMLFNFIYIFYTSLFLNLNIS